VIVAAVRSDDAGSFGSLMAAIRAELAAFDGGDPQQIEAATTAKLTALDMVQAEAIAGFPPARTQIEAARGLNNLAQRRAMKLAASVDRRLARLRRTSPRGEALCYGPDGRRE
jgi:hypothetical protein